MPDKMIGRALGDFRIEELIGRGAVGRVYRARQISLDRPVAVKILEEGIFTLEDVKQRFLREAEFMAKLEHPNIVPVYAAGHIDNVHFFAMRLVHGRTLAEHMTAGLPLPDGIRHLAEICGALEYAHRLGFIHRDIKPANIMIADGAALLMDFGLARFQETTTITTSGMLLGTPLYFSPEQAKREPALPQSDLYSLGIILYELAAGRHPFVPNQKPGPSVDQIIARVSEGLYDPPDGAPHRVQQAIARALAPNPADRYPSARDMQTALLSLLG